MERTHLAPVPTVIVVEPRDQPDWPEYKPRGFWYEVDGDWRRWCREDGMRRWLDQHYLHRVQLGDERLLLISTPDGLDAFTATYGVKHLQQTDQRSIRWDRVAEDWDGIEVAPYQWTRRLDLFWYYSWDCASGCIWRPRGVTTDLVSPEALAAQ